MFQAEAVVSLRTRRGGGEKPVFVQREIPADGFQTIQVKNLTAGGNAGSCVTKKAPRATKVAGCGVFASKTPPSTGMSLFSFLSVEYDVHYVTG